MDRNAPRELFRFDKADVTAADDAAVAATDDRHPALQFSTATMLLVLGSRPRLHFIFPARLLSLLLRRLRFLFLKHWTFRALRVAKASQRRRLRVRAAFFAAAERDRAERCFATRFACFDNARFDAARRLSRLSARLVARERLEEGFLRRAARPFARSRFA